MNRRQGRAKRRPGTAAAIAAAVISAAASCALLAGCSSATAIQSQPAREATIVPTSAAEIPTGWVLHRGPGFEVALPPEWTNRPKQQRAAPQAALEVGEPFTGQPHPPPLFMGFVERDQVGPLTLREKVLRLQLQAGLPGATLGASTHLKVAGSLDAVSFDLVYQDAGGRSVLGTPIAATVFRQRELIVETPGLPKFGFRYAAPQAEFDPTRWAEIVHSIVVIPVTGS